MLLFCECSNNFMNGGKAKILLLGEICFQSIYQIVYKYYYFYYMFWMYILLLNIML